MKHQLYICYSESPLFYFWTKLVELNFFKQHEKVFKKTKDTAYSSPRFSSFPNVHFHFKPMLNQGNLIQMS